MFKAGEIVKIKNSLLWSGFTGIVLQELAAGNIYSVGILGTLPPAARLICSRECLELIDERN